jgi:hypothetical protein
MKGLTREAIDGSKSRYTYAKWVILRELAGYGAPTCL